MVLRYSRRCLLLIVVHIAQAHRFRLWWLFPTAVLCGLLEILGWSGRLWSSRNPTLHKAFVMQCVSPMSINFRTFYADRESRGRISTTILAPTPFIAASFIILGRITKRLGPQYCRLSFKWCEWFCLKEYPKTMCTEHIQHTHRHDRVYFMRE